MGIAQGVFFSFSVHCDRERPAGGEVGRQGHKLGGWCSQVVLP